MVLFYHGKAYACKRRVKQQENCNVVYITLNKNVNFCQKKAISDGKGVAYPSGIW